MGVEDILSRGTADAGLSVLAQYKELSHPELVLGVDHVIVNECEARKAAVDPEDVGVVRWLVPIVIQARIAKQAMLVKVFAVKLGEVVHVQFDHPT
jgi:hypothetical protein